jgi:enamine deaminase RidA (YjgF/YER057c/UK114 family)
VQEIPMTVEYPVVADLAKSPAYSAVAVIAAEPTEPPPRWVLIGGQNAVDAQGHIVGGDDLRAQALQVRANVEAALAAANCTWAEVVRITVHLKAGCDPRLAFGAFQSALSGRAAPPLVGVYQVVALARPEFLIEVSAEAVR